MEPANDDVKKARKMLPWGVPAIAITLGLSYFAGIEIMVSTIADLLALSPVVRVTTGAILNIAVLPMLLLMAIGLVLKSIPLASNLQKPISKALNFLLFFGVFLLLVVIPVVTFLQYQYMPGLGYSKCNELRGHPTMWFNDWVRNPAWCVRGKDRAWVLEQAKKG